VLDVVELDLQLVGLELQLTSNEVPVSKLDEKGVVGLSL
jgi:hypothetical protein